MKKTFFALLFISVFSVLSFSDNHRDFKMHSDNYYFGLHYPYYTLSGQIGGGFIKDYYLYNISYNPFYWDYNSYYYYKYNDDAKKAYKKIEKLEEKKKKEISVRKKLGNITVLKAKFYKQYSSDAAPLSMAEISIDNGSRYSIKKIYFRGSLKTHLTNKVIIDGVFNYEIANVLESSDRATYKIPLNTFGNWAKIKAPDMAVFEVTVEGIETAGGNKIHTGNFTPSDNKLLKKLKREYGY